MRRFFYALCLIVGIAFVWGIVQLFEIRFARGDVYPPYSSLRSDPLGAKAFYESLAHLDQIQVWRNEKSLDQFIAGKGTTLFYIGANSISSSEVTAAKVERFVKSGGRLVVAFYPQAKETFLAQRDEKQNPSPSPTASPDEEPPLVKFLTTHDLAARWEFKLGASAKLAESSAERVGLGDVDPEISWHSALHFKDSGAVWKNIYTSSEFPVVIERQLGEGTIVLASDSYFLSNEAMRRGRHPAFLAWLVGPNRQISFDETHLGIREDPGVSTLMRRYHLGGLLVGLLVLAAVAVWKNTARLLPTTESEGASDEIIAGKDSFAGFVNLLRRNILPSELLPICAEEWSKCLPRKVDKSQDQIALPQRIIGKSSPHDVVKTYREISRAISQIKWKPHNSLTR